MTLEDQKTLQRLKRLEVKIYRGLHLNADNVDVEVIDQWIDRVPNLSADLEKLLNYIHIFDFFLGVQDEVNLENFAKEIAQEWKTLLSTTNPGYRVIKYKSYGPEVTFYFDHEMASAE